MGFGRSKNKFALLLDFKGALNDVLLGPLIAEMKDLGVLVGLLLFNLALRKLEQYLPAGVRLAMYTDDLHLYFTGGSINEASVLLRIATDGFIP